MKVLVGILNGLVVVVSGLLIYGSFLLQPGDGGQPATAGGALGRVWLGCWFVYSMICIPTTFATHKGPAVLVPGIVAHLILVACVVLDSGSGLSTWLTGCVIAVIYATLWFRMYSKLRPTPM